MNHFTPFGPLGMPSELGVREGDLERREAQLARYQILGQDYQDLLVRRVRGIYTDPEVTSGLVGWADTATAVNPANDIVNALACVYKRPPIREFVEGGDDTDKAWTKVHRLARTDQQAKEINRLAYGIGPVCVLATVIKGRPALEYHAPHRYQILWDEADPYGPPKEVAIDLRPGFRLYSGDSHNLGKDQAAYAVVDAETWRYFNHENQPVAGPQGLSVVAHGVVDAQDDPVNPATFFRVDEPRREDWWNRKRAGRLFTSTITAGLLWCRLRYVRQYQDLIQLLTRLPDGSVVQQGGVVGHPGKPLEVAGATAAGASLEAVELNQPIDDFLRDLSFVYASASISEGLPSEYITPYAVADAGRMPGTRINATSATDKMLAQKRNDQIAYADGWERLFAERMIGTLRAQRSSLVDKSLVDDLPPLDEVADRHMVEWAELTASDSPADQREQDEFDLGHGVISRVDLTLRRFPYMNRAQALEHLRRNADEDAEVWEIQATRNQPRDPAALANIPLGESRSPAQANGALGPLVRDAPDEESPTDD